jgi:hypothetical protein
MDRFREQDADDGALFKRDQIDQHLTDELLSPNHTLDYIIRMAGMLNKQ